MGMRFFLRFSLFIIFYVPYFAFTQNIDKKFISFHQGIHDYGIKVFEGKLSNFDSSISQTFRVGYNRRLSKSILFSTGVSNGFLLSGYKEASGGKKSYALGIDAGFLLLTNNDKLFKKDATVFPYFSFGYQYFYINDLKKGDFNPNEFSLQYGIGIDCRLRKGLSLQIQSNLNQELSKQFNTFFIHRIGLVQDLGFIGNPNANNLNIQILPKDYDGDGIEDKIDKCPTIAGIQSKMGCPQDYVNEEQKANARIDSLENLLKLNRSKLDLKNKEIDSILTNRNIEVSKSNLKDSILTNEAINQTKQISSPRVKSESEDIEIVYEKGNHYYIVIQAALSKDWILVEANKAKVKFPNVKVISLPNGYYRTAIYCEQGKEEAKILLKEVLNSGYKQAWIALF